MNAFAEKFDAWGPVSTALYESDNSDFVQNAIGNTGMRVDWRPLTRNEAYSHGTRIRAYRDMIQQAYQELDNEQKGHVAQVIVRAILDRHDGDRIREGLVNRLQAIGWTITADGLLVTEDALIREEFFPPNSPHDAYVRIREILERAEHAIFLEDPYVGSALLQTLSALPQRKLEVNLLTSRRNLRQDFGVEVSTFRRQVGHINLEIRTTQDFHDRFISIDDTEFYHVGASIKDAGNRAFMISRIEDQTNITKIRESLRDAWDNGQVWQP